MVTVTSCSPGNGIILGGTPITIGGTGFGTGGSLYIYANAVGPDAGDEISYTYVSTTQITATTPNSYGGGLTYPAKVNLQFVNSTAGQGNLINAFEYTTANAILSPTTYSGAMSTGGGIAIEFTGNNFQYGTINVFINGTEVTPAYVRVDTNTQLVINPCPAGPSGYVNIYVVNEYGPSVIGTMQYVSAPTVTGVSPNTGAANGNTSTTITITGTDFIQNGVTVAYDVALGSYDYAENITVVSATSITVTGYPNLTVAEQSPAQVLVYSDGGTGTYDYFTYANPTVTSVSPNTGTAAGGNTVTITGNNFTSAQQVYFGGNTAKSFSFNSDTSITATSPAGSGLVDITVVTYANTSATGSADLFAYLSGGATLIFHAPMGGM